MFENNFEEEKKRQEEINRRVIGKIKSSFERSTKEEKELHINTLKRIGDNNAEFKKEVVEFLKKQSEDREVGQKATKAAYDLMTPELKEEPKQGWWEERGELHEKRENSVESGLNKKESSFYKADEGTQKKSVDNIISNILLTEKEEPKIGLIHLLSEISKNTPHESVKKSILEGLNKIAMEAPTLKSGVEAAEIYEKLVLKEKGGFELKTLSELHRKVMSHPPVVSPLTLEDENITLRNIEKMGKYGLKNEKLKNAAIEYFKNMETHPNYLVNRWAQEARLKLGLEK
jgi:hypothetical protein